MENESVHHHCGLFGIYGHPEAVRLTYLALYAQQHRGQESAGICSTDGARIQRHAGLGLVTDVFDPAMLQSLRNPIAIGHVRYSTTGSCTGINCQPFLVTCGLGQVAVGHNGNLINAALLRKEYESRGQIFSTTSDTEVILHVLAKHAQDAARVPMAHVLGHLQGAYCLVFLFPDQIVAVRDPYGLRPLSLGRTAEGAVVVASETCAFDIIDATYERDVEPGEIVFIDKYGVRSDWIVPAGSVRPAHCIFEQVYFADPASHVFGENVHVVRRAMGRQLAREAPVEADAVIPVPNCARCAALGYSEESRIPYTRGFVTSHYAGRSFIMPSQNLRDLAVKMKLNVIKETVKGQRLVVVEDSIVRGTTTRGKIGALRRAGAKEIHLRVASPPIQHACYFGIDFPTQTELIAHDKNIEQIRAYLGVESLHYLSLEGMLACVKHPPEHYCTACFSGNYPMAVDQPVSKFAME
ncbi:MAG: amidophosphoribosyltransferase [Phycisphaerae bacterium]|nr:amidophosphoribosyltransferase [Phycisphaerae bacterium]